LILYNRLKHKKSNKRKNTEEDKKWVTFTYTRNYIRKFTKLFKNTNLKVAFETITAVGKLVSDTRTTNTYEQSGIYKMTFQSCRKVYIGQTGQHLTTRYKEHIRNIRFSKEESAFAQHILDKLWN
jgi:mevalonate kinase